ncbi:hypothetical protein P171DRAFT_445862 [Karstenula rhodostoma CBS 690.94]|uniref:Uncharacterized protein n=1 Tax=Karstenula rhodostoma CBS 690.94 TaxID=1392251 RepID=A0A9P4PDY8_9PLEO|nr:hypothetical protein P171DRAFT_445862 [Karstenula rhodostoma CBS 690.94]
MAAYSTISSQRLVRGPNHRDKRWYGAFSIDLKHLRCFLENDAFGLGFRPFEYLRTIEIVFDNDLYGEWEPEVLHEGTLTYACGREVKLKVWMREIVNLDMLEEQLKDFAAVYKVLDEVLGLQKDTNTIVMIQWDTEGDEPAELYALNRED